MAGGEPQMKATVVSIDCTKCGISYDCSDP